MLTFNEPAQHLFRVFAMCFAACASSNMYLSYASYDKYHVNIVQQRAHHLLLVRIMSFMLHLARHPQRLVWDIVSLSLKCPAIST